MAICKICGWRNPEGAEHCERCNASLMNDVFISYSRKDYVDADGNILPNNMLSKIKELFKSHGITYWFDEEGIYSGDEFASVLTRAIRNSRIFLFISSTNSNQSKWTSNEISTALEFKKIIIPFRLDESPYNDSVMMKIVSFDYIECKDEDKAMNKLLRAVKHHLPSEEKFQRKSIINVPDGTRGATVIFDVGGQRTKSVFSYDNDNETQIIDGRQDAIGQDADVPSPKNNKNDVSPGLSSKRISNNNLRQLAIFLVLVIIGAGLLLLWNGNKSARNQQLEASLHDNITEECKPIDLGLTSGTMWADRNVGASVVSDFGDLYAWGETEKKKDYSQGMYDSKDKPQSIISSSEYNVAAVILGEGWTIPTEEQFKELLNECQWNWTLKDGHYGYEITGKNGNKIFLPASGWICSNQPDYQNKYGYYWTSERVPSNPQFARNLQFPKNGKGIIGNGYLYYGRSVRAVYNGEAVAE